MKNRFGRENSNPALKHTVTTLCNVGISRLVKLRAYVDGLLFWHLASLAEGLLSSPLSVCPSVRPSIHLSVPPSVRLCLSVCLSVCLSRLSPVILVKARCGGSNMKKIDNAVFEIVLGELMDSRSINELTFGGPTFTFGGPKKYAISKKLSLNHDFTK